MKNALNDILRCIAVAMMLFLIPVLAGAEVGTGETYVLTLDDAVGTALLNNLDVKLVREDVEFATGGVELAKSVFGEVFKADVGVDSTEYSPLSRSLASREEKDRLGASLLKRLPFGTEVGLLWDSNRYDSDSEGLFYNPSYGTSFSIEVRQPLLRGFGTEIQTSSIHAAEEELGAAVFEVDSRSADLAAEVKKGYWDLVFALQNIEVHTLSLSLAKRLLKETEEKISAGKLAEVDVYQPKSEVARREEDLIAAERSIGLAEDQLKLLMNSENWQISLQPSDTPQKNPVQLNPENILAKALVNRADFQVVEKNIEAARIHKRLAEDGLKPELDLVGRYGVGGNDDTYGNSLNAVTDDTNTHWQVGLNLTIPMSNTAAKGNLRQAKSRYSKAQMSLERLRLQIKKSVRTTVRDVELAIKGMDATHKTTIATFKRLEAEQAKFEAGRSTTLDVLTAQEAYAKALSQENQTAIAYVQLLAELDRIQGVIALNRIQ